jgi:hypothetical protein
MNNLLELSSHERAKAVIKAVLRVLATWTLLLLAYVAYPDQRLNHAQPIVSLTFGCILVTAILAWQVRQILKADLPGLRASEALAVVIPLFLFVFASVYLSIDSGATPAFTSGLDHIKAIYMATTIFSTVGFGDITPVTNAARLLVCAQMILDLVVIGAVARLLFGAARHGASRGQAAQEQ